MIRLNSEASGGQPILKPCVVNGGTGDDTIFGGYGNDRPERRRRATTRSSAGRAWIIITGGAGADRMYGGAGNDRLIADTADQFVVGQAGTDVIAFERVDPAVLANYNEATMKAALQVGLSGWSFSQSQGGEKITVKNLQVQDVAIENGTTTVHLKADIRYQKTSGFPQFSVSGTIKFSVQPQLSAYFVEGSLTSASIKLANPDVKEVNLQQRAELAGQLLGGAELPGGQTRAATADPRHRPAADRSWRPAAASGRRSVCNTPRSVVVGLALSRRRLLSRPTARTWVDAADWGLPAVRESL